jgi:DNA-binding NtrC family response regulator
MSAGRILVVDDDAEMCALLEAGLGKRGFEVTTRTSGDAAIALLDNADFDAIVVDLNMPGTSGLDVSTWVAANRADTPVVVITAFGTLETAVAAIRAGAYDFVTKPFELGAVSLTLDRAVGYCRLRSEVRRLRLAAAADQMDFDQIGLPGTALVGRSPAMRRTFDTILRAAATDASVLVTGESGTGKDLLAHFIHYRGPRRDGPLLKIHCPSIPEDLLESELFGHEKGAFTDAKQAKAGKIELAHGGTLYFDQVHDLQPPLQAKLLRVVEEQRFERLGGTRTIEVDVRLVSSASHDLREAVSAGRFREDLDHRLSGVPLELPPLRERREDVLPLAETFLARERERQATRARAFARDAADLLRGYHWPGNVRELRSVVERAALMAAHETVTAAALPTSVLEQPAALWQGRERRPSLKEVEQAYIRHVLEQVQGNQTRAASVLGISRKALWEKRRRYGMP